MGVPLAVEVGFGEGIGNNISVHFLYYFKVNWL